MLLGLPYRPPPIPDGDVDAEDRMHFVDLYSGMLAAPPLPTKQEFDVYTGLQDRNVTVQDETIDTRSTVVAGAEFILRGQCAELSVTLELSGGSPVALSGFIMEVQLVPEGPWFEAVTEWDNTEDGMLLFSSGPLEVLPHTTKGGVSLSLLGNWGVRFKSSMASSPALPVTRTMELAFSLPR